jgi:hypothetical protein
MIERSSPSFRLVVTAGLALMTFAWPANAANYVANVFQVSGLDDVSPHHASGVSIAGHGRGALTAGVDHALLWTHGVMTDLHPPEMADSQLGGIDGDTQVGLGYDGAAGTYRALLWYGSQESVVQLHPTGYEFSAARAVDGATQVGEGGIGHSVHAMLWHGTAASAVDLHPAGYHWSEANGVDGANQVGAGGPGPGFPVDPHALMWSGSAASVVDLHPSGFDISYGRDVEANHQVGWATSNFKTPQERTEAMIWSGSAASALSLHPTGFLHSEAWATAGAYQVGVAHTPQHKSHAMLWQGTASSAVDLHELVAADPAFQANSYTTAAYDVTEDGTVVGSAFSRGVQYGVIWRRIEADLNNDEAVDSGDLNAWRSAFGNTSGTPRLAGDVDGDGAVDGNDFLLWQRHVDASSSAVAKVPEPSTALLSVGLMARLALIRKGRFVAV